MLPRSSACTSRPPTHACAPACWPRYPDGSVYTGSWAKGFKDGPGVYWDVCKGCMRGSWSRGVLKGHAVYDQPAMHYEGVFVQVGGGRTRCCVPSTHVPRETCVLLPPVPTCAPVPAAQLLWCQDHAQLTLRPCTHEHARAHTHAQGVPAGPCHFTITSHRTLDLPKFAAAHILAEGGPTLRGGAVYSIPPGSGDDPELDEEGQPIEDADKPALPSRANGCVRGGRDGRAGGARTWQGARTRLGCCSNCGPWGAGAHAAPHAACLPACLQV